MRQLAAIVCAGGAAQMWIVSAGTRPNLPPAGVFDLTFTLGGIAAVGGGKVA